MGCEGVSAETTPQDFAFWSESGKNVGVVNVPVIRDESYQYVSSDGRAAGPWVPFVSPRGHQILRAKHSSYKLPDSWAPLRRKGVALAQNQAGGSGSWRVCLTRLSGQLVWLYLKEVLFLTPHIRNNLRAKDEIHVRDQKSRSS